MGQIQVCEPKGAIGGPGASEPGDLLPREQGAGPLPFCSCLPAGTLRVQECCVSSKRHTKTEKIWLDDDHFGSDASSVNSDGGEGTSAKLSHLVLARHRLFSPHLQFKFAHYYQTERKIGEGSYGNVYEALARPVNSKDGRPLGKGKAVDVDTAASTPSNLYPRRVAVKAFSLEKNNKQEDKDRALRELQGRRASFEAERSILSQLEHPHIIKMYECFEEKSSLYIVLELCRGGELYERIAAKARQGAGGGLDEKTSRNIFRQMLYATSYLHANRVVHRDIKSENFLLLGEPGTPEADTIKLCDFGTAAVLSEQKPRSMERIGTLSYTAPEIYANRGASVVADNWSLGVVLYVLLVGASPFRTSGNESREETMRRIQHGDFETRRPAWQNLTHLAQDLVRKFLVVEEAQRLSSKKALRHAWVEPGDGSSRLSSLRANSTLPASPRGTGGGDLGTYGIYGKTVVMLLEKFTRLDAMQQLVLIICAQTMQEADLINSQAPVPWYDLFFALDRNEDGQLGFQEFAMGLRQLLGSASIYSDEQLDSMVRALDLDCSGQIEWIEWAAVALLATQNLVQEAEPLSTAFRLLDRPSGDGTVGAADLLAVINSDSKSMFITSTVGREQVLRILSRWVPRPSTKKDSKWPNGFVSPPSMKLEDMRKVLESCSKEPENQLVPIEAYPQRVGTNWFRHPWCGDDQRCPDTNTELNVMVQQQRALRPKGKKGQQSASVNTPAISAPAAGGAAAPASTQASSPSRTTSPDRLQSRDSALPSSEGTPMVPTSQSSEARGPSARPASDVAEPNPQSA